MVAVSPPANPKIPCHGCGVEERFLTMKESTDWTMAYVNDEEWVAYCPDCDVTAAEARARVEP